ncbi:hypothetical protein CBS101457_005519 [Exobasidium rhododendri]|nr:hypothetical protein CBS101457_005519 [Exobasidium rhododendri]
MPFARIPTPASRTSSADRQRPRPRREETSSPPRRNNTIRKVNVISKASIAMLNPAYAMGIEVGPSWCEEEEKRWKEENEERSMKVWSNENVSPLHVPSSVSSKNFDSFRATPTPELEAFAGEDFSSITSSPFAEGGALGLTLDATSMVRKGSTESCFEDDEPALARNKAAFDVAGQQQSSNNSSLSRLFTWKRSTKGKPSSTPAEWDVPQSAPPQITSFDIHSLAPVGGEHGFTSSPSMPMESCTLPPPTTSKKVTRKSSMPTLRDIRKATGSPLAQGLPLPDPSAVASFYWRGTESSTTPIIGLGTPMRQSTFTSTHPARAAARSSSRISSVGRGAARKSTVDILMPIPNPPKQNKKKSKRIDQWNSPDMPPLPMSTSISMALAAEEEEGESVLEERSSSSFTKSHTRQRSNSADALFTKHYSTLPAPSPTLHVTDTSEMEKEEDYEVVRVSVANRGIIGVSSPRLLAKASPVMMGSSPQRQQRKSVLLEVCQPTVVVNVMPPTPDLAAEEQAKFDGEVASPSVRRSRSEAELTSLIDGHNFADIQASPFDGKLEEKGVKSEPIADVDSDDESFLPYITGHERYDNVTHLRNHSNISDLSDFTTSAASEATDGTDEPFGFTRSLSTLSLASDDSSTGSEISEEEVACVQHAKILSASSTTSSFSRAQLVSPSSRSRDVTSWSSQSGSGAFARETSRSSLESFASEEYQHNNTGKRFGNLPSLSSGQSLASVMTTSTSILDFGSDTAHIAAFNNSDYFDLSSPVELQEDGDFDTPKLSGCATMGTQTTRPLLVRKLNSSASAKEEHPTQQPEQQPSFTFSPVSPRRYPRAHNATSPHLELDLSLPLDLNEIGLGFAFDDLPKKRGERPRVPLKSQARKPHYVSPFTGEPQTPPSTIRRLSGISKDNRHEENFGLGLGLGLVSALQLGEDDGSQRYTMMTSSIGNNHDDAHDINRDSIPSRIGFAF